MFVELPKPIAACVEANARLDLEGMLRPFIADAVITDNGHRYEGQAGLRRLFEESGLPVKAIFTPDRYWMTWLAKATLLASSALASEAAEREPARPWFTAA